METGEAGMKSTDRLSKAKSENCQKTEYQRNKTQAIRHNTHTLQNELVCVCLCVCVQKNSFYSLHLIYKSGDVELTLIVWN